MANIEIESNENKKEKENNVYKSKEGFIKLLVRRGIDQIRDVIELVNKYKDYSFICGGYVRYCISIQHNPQPASDVDIYVANEETFKNISEELKKHLSIKHENDISLTFNVPSDIENPYYFHPPIQLIKPNRIGKIVADFTPGKIEEVLNNFDFTIIRCALINDKEAIADADFEHDDKNNILRIKNIHCPISSTMRIIKYSKKGFYAPPTQILKLFLDWEDRDEEYKSKLKDYLEKANEGKGLSQKEVDELESLLRID